MSLVQSSLDIVPAAEVTIVAEVCSSISSNSGGSSSGGHDFGHVGGSLRLVEVVVVVVPI